METTEKDLVALTTPLFNTRRAIVAALVATTGIGYAKATHMVDVDNTYLTVDRFLGRQSTEVQEAFERELKANLSK